MNTKFKKMLRKIAKYFLQGLLLLVPIGLTIFIIYWVFLLIIRLIPFNNELLGILIILGGITFIGFLASTIIARPFIHYINKLMDRLPIIKIIYSSIKDLMSAFVGSKKKFNVPVLVKMYKDSGIEKLGFVTESDLQLLGKDLEGKIAVYLPHSYNFSGNLFIVPRENVTMLDCSPTDVMKFIVSGGVTNLQQDKNQEE